ncbi:hypothetical protein RF55_18751 [Lasius niger]|uniref:Uncharacterized protein n=1 Tax=Lasius niger TaxID=67767 RepID=A0A0J7K175_LASNI|nr:hypothetical protein RF55_18751 [Lasius niger]
MTIHPSGKIVQKCCSYIVWDLLLEKRERQIYGDEPSSEEEEVDVEEVAEEQPQPQQPPPQPQQQPPQQQPPQQPSLDEAEDEEDEVSSSDSAVCLIGPR